MTTTSTSEDLFHGWLADPQACDLVPQESFVQFLMGLSLEEWAEGHVVELVQDGIPEDVAQDMVRIVLQRHLEAES